MSSSSYTVGDGGDVCGLTGRDQVYLIDLSCYSITEYLLHHVPASKLATDDIISTTFQSWALAFRNLKTP